MPRRTKHGLTTLSAAAIGILGAACASSSAVREREVVSPTSTVVTTASGSTMSIETQTQRYARETVLDLTPEAAYTALPLAFGFLGIEVRTHQDSERMMGNTNFIARRQLKGERLSSYVDCGRGATLQNNADNYEVRFSVLSQIVPADEGKVAVRTRVDATARSLATTSNRITCTSTGELERRIAEHVRAEARAR